MSKTECEACYLMQIRAAMRLLNITAESLLAAIRNDMERGLVDQARRRLAFVDRIVEAK